MIYADYTNLETPLRSIKGKVELFNSSTIAASGETVIIENASIQTIDISVVNKNLINSNKDFGTGNIWFNVTSYNDYFYLAAGTYTFSVVTADGKNCAVYAQNAIDNTNINVNWDGTSVTFTLEEDAPVKLKVYKASYTSADAIVSAQLELGTQATKHIPHYTSFEGVEVSVNDEIYTPTADGVIKDVYIEGTTTITTGLGILISTKYKVTDLINTFNNTDNLKSFKVERVGERGKFFGFGVSQKLTVNLLDKNREIDIIDGAVLIPHLTTEEEYEGSAITNEFIVNGNETKRNENTNELTIVAYDKLFNATAHTVAELELEAPYTINDVVNKIITVLDISYTMIPFELFNPFQPFNLSYPNGANFEGTETLKDVLDDIAEATQTIYFISGDNTLTFKRLGAIPTTDLTIDKSLYFELEGKEPITLAAISSVTELGDNVIATSSITTGVTQYIRDNDFIALREDIADILDKSLKRVEGLTITPFSCSWRGNYYLEIGDKIALETKEGGLITSYVLDDVIEYNGALKQKTQWSYEEKQTANNNPTTLGEALKETYAKVDKANKQIDMVVSETNTNTEIINAIQVSTEGINASISALENKVNDASDTISSLSQRVEAQLTETDVSIKIQEELANGVETVTTGKGYTFNNEGLTIEDISEKNNAIKTTVSNNGMVVFSNNDEVLKANDEGVKAVDLHATTFLIIGDNSRFEDYGKYTACFWIGGNN